MTPAERIAQLTAERAGGVIPRPPVVRAHNRVTQEPTPADPVAGRTLPEAWRKTADDWQNRERRQAAIDRETRIAAWAVSRCLGDGWHYELQENTGRVHIVYRDGYGFSFCRVWNDSSTSSSKVVAMRPYVAANCVVYVVCSGRPV